MITLTRTNTIGVATTEPDQHANPYVDEVLEGAREAAAPAGRELRVFTLANWAQGAGRLSALCRGQVDALLLLAPLLDAQAARTLPAHLPMVSVHANHALPGVVNLESAEEAGACAMVQHMLQLGHRRILHIAGPRDFIGSQRRLAGYLKAHADARIKPLPHYIVHSELSVEAGREAMREWLQLHRRKLLPQAVFAANDSIAIGCLQALAAQGLRTPQDISVVGFDDTEQARTAKLATVRQPLRTMGRRAIELLLDRIDGMPAPEPQNIVFPTEIVFSHSFSAPRAVSLSGS